MALETFDCNETDTDKYWLLMLCPKRVSCYVKYVVRRTRTFKLFPANTGFSSLGYPGGPENIRGSEVWGEGGTAW